MEVLEEVVSAGVDWLARTDEIMLVMLREALELQHDAQVGGSIREQIAVQAHVVSILSLLGFSPTARARLGLTTVKRVSKLEQLRQHARRDRV